jgi:hypothetical protein
MKQMSIYIIIKIVNITPHFDYTQGSLLEDSILEVYLLLIIPQAKMKNE